MPVVRWDRPESAYLLFAGAAWTALHTAIGAFVGPGLKVVASNMDEGHATPKWFIYLLDVTGNFITVMFGFSAIWSWYLGYCDYKKVNIHIHIRTFLKLMLISTAFCYPCVPDTFFPFQSRNRWDAELANLRA